jgi:hypothetical protein
MTCLNDLIRNIQVAASAATREQYGQTRVVT